jgi:hypothetical protein
METKYKKKIASAFGSEEEMIILNEFVFIRNPPRNIIKYADEVVYFKILCKQQTCFSCAVNYVITSR